MWRKIGSQKLRMKSLTRSSTPIQVSMRTQMAPTRSCPTTTASTPMMKMVRSQQPRRLKLIPTVIRLLEPAVLPAKLARRGRLRPPTLCSRSKHWRLPHFMHGLPHVKICVMSESQSPACALATPRPLCCLPGGGECG